jgi:rhodanese-related sulfurtransferase
MKSQAVISAALVGAYFATASIAQDTIQNASFVFNGQQKNITQSLFADTDTISALYQLPSDCTGLCLAPHQAAEGVATVIENDVVDFLVNDVALNAGLIIDSRKVQDHLRGHLPASINVPAGLITPSNPLLPDILRALGAKDIGGRLNFDDAMPLIIYDDGPTQNDASTLINALLSQGYPPSAIRYYRGGMLVWATLGLTTEGTPS